MGKMFSIVNIQGMMHTLAATARGLLLYLLILCHALPPSAANCPSSRSLTFQVEHEIYRDQLGFTEGLEMHDGALYESTGDAFGDSGINRIDPTSGKVHTIFDAGKRYFSEGLTFFDGRLYQMTWREHRVLVFDRQMRQMAELANPREGWGLTHDTNHLIASDGTARLYFLSPQDFSTLGQVTVTQDGHKVSNLNELEYAAGAIWANVFQQWRVVKINPVTGCVEASADLRPLRERLTPADRRAIDADPNFVPNGIAYTAAGGLFTLTGKYWPVLFFGRFVEKR
jgi:glutamine cyclotransferase